MFCLGRGLSAIRPAHAAICDTPHEPSSVRGALPDAVSLKKMKFFLCIDAKRIIVRFVHIVSV